MIGAVRTGKPAAPTRAGPLVLALSTFVLLILGTLTWRRGHAYLDAEALWRDTLLQNPTAFIAHTNLGALLLLRGELEPAQQLFEAALRLKPDDAESLDNLGLVRQRQGRIEEAIALYREAVRCDPECVDARNNLGVVLAQQGHAPEALEQFREAVRVRPSFAKAHRNLGLTLEALERPADAVGAYRESLRFAPEALDVARRLAWILATDPDAVLRNGDEAVRLAEAVSAGSGGRDPQAEDVLAAAYAEAGRFDDAVHASERALELAGPSSSEDARRGVNARLELYRSRRAFRSRTK